MFSQLINYPILKSTCFRQATKPFQRVHEIMVIKLPQNLSETSTFLHMYFESVADTLKYRSVACLKQVLFGHGACDRVTEATQKALRNLSETSTFLHRGPNSMENSPK